MKGSGNEDVQRSLSRQEKSLRILGQTPSARRVAEPNRNREYAPMLGFSRSVFTLLYHKRVGWFDERGLMGPPAVRCSLLGSGDTPSKAATPAERITSVARERGGGGGYPAVPCRVLSFYSSWSVPSSQQSVELLKQQKRLLSYHRGRGIFEGILLFFALMMRPTTVRQMRCT